MMPSPFHFPFSHATMTNHPTTPAGGNAMAGLQHNLHHHHQHPFHIHHNNNNLPLQVNAMAVPAQSITAASTATPMINGGTSGFHHHNHPHHFNHNGCLVGEAMPPHYPHHRQHPMSMSSQQLQQQRPIPYGAPQQPQQHQHHQQAIRMIPFPSPQQPPYSSVSAFSSATSSFSNYGPQHQPPLPPIIHRFHNEEEEAQRKPLAPIVKNSNNSHRPNNNNNSSKNGIIILPNDLASSHAPPNNNTAAAAKIATTPAAPNHNRNSNGTGGGGGREGYRARVVARAMTELEDIGDIDEEEEAQGRDHLHDDYDHTMAHKDDDEPAAHRGHISFLPSDRTSTATAQRNETHAGGYPAPTMNTSSNNNSKRPRPPNTLMDRSLLTEGMTLITLAYHQGRIGWAAVELPCSGAPKEGTNPSLPASPQPSCSSCDIRCGEFPEAAPSRPRCLVQFVQSVLAPSTTAPSEVSNKSTSTAIPDPSATSSHRRRRVTFLVSSRFNGHLLNGLRQTIDNLTTSSSAPCVDVQLISHDDFSANQCHETLKLLFPTRTSLNWATCLDASAVAMWMSLGGLLCYLVKRINVVLTEEQQGSRTPTTTMPKVALPQRQGPPPHAAAALRPNTKDAGIEGSPPVGAIRIRDIVQGSTGKLLVVTPEAYHGLQIFRAELHPAAHHGIGSGAKEGLSLFSLFITKCRTDAGREHMKSWFMLPTAEKRILNRRLDAVEFLCSAVSQQHLSDIMIQLRNVRDLSRIFQRVREGIHSSRDLNALLRTAQALSNLHSLVEPLAACSRNNGQTDLSGPPGEKRESEVLRRKTEEADSVFSCAKSFITLFEGKAFTEITQLITRTVDFASNSSHRSTTSATSASANSSSALNHNNSSHNNNGNRVHILPGVDSNLDELRNTYASLDTFLTIVAREEVQKLPQRFNFPVTVIFYPQIGYLLCADRALFSVQSRSLDADGRGSGSTRRGGGRGGGRSNAPMSELQPMLFPEGWELSFTLQESCYFKSSTMRDLDTEVGDIHAAVVAAEARARQRLDEALLALEDRIVPCLRPLAEMDCVVAMAQVAIEEMWTRPIFVDSSSSERRHHRQQDMENKTNNTNRAASAAAVAIVNGGEETVDATPPTPSQEQDRIASSASAASPEQHVDGFLSLTRVRHPMLARAHSSGAFLMKMNRQHRTQTTATNAANAPSATAAQTAEGDRQQQQQQHQGRPSNSTSNFPMDATASSRVAFADPTTVIPCNFECATESWNRATIVTGPNGSGKSIFVRSVALTVFLAHIGSFVPCERAIIGEFDCIASNDEVESLAWLQQSLHGSGAGGFGGGGGQTGSAMLLRGHAMDNIPAELRSSFGHELAAVGSALKAATRRTLLVLDEFGCGTLATDGIALLAAIVNHTAAAAVAASSNNPKPAAATEGNNAAVDKDDDVDVNEANPPPHRATTNTAAGMSSSSSPVLLLTTHYTEIFREGLVALNSVQWLTMATHVSIAADSSSQKKQEENCGRKNSLIIDDVLTFLFQPVPGSLDTTLSQALYCAKLADMPQGVLDRARDLLQGQLVLRERRPRADEAVAPTDTSPKANKNTHVMMAADLPPGDEVENPTEDATTSTPITFIQQHQQQALMTEPQQQQPSSSIIHREVSQRSQNTMNKELGQSACASTMSILYDRTRSGFSGGFDRQHKPTSTTAVLPISNTDDDGDDDNAGCLVLAEGSSEGERSSSDPSKQSAEGDAQLVAAPSLCCSRSSSCLTSFENENTA